MTRLEFHDHDDPTGLHVGCTGCIERMKRDQLLASLPELNVGDLTDMLAATPESDEELSERLTRAIERATEDSWADAG